MSGLAREAGIKRSPNEADVTSGEANYVGPATPVGDSPRAPKRIFPPSQAMILVGLKQRRSDDPSSGDARI